MEMEDDHVRVLLVEDSPSDALLLREHLSQYPLQTFDVRHAECLADAVELLAQKLFDVILLDLNLPDANGLETCVRMNKAARRVPIIVLTGMDDEKIAWEAMREGIEDYLVKGQILGGSLARAIRYAVERSRTQKALRDSEARLKFAQHSAGAGTWDWDMSTGKLHWSEELFGLLGLDPSRTKATFDVWRSVLHPDDRQGAEARVEQAIRDHALLKNEYRIVLSTGQVRWLSVLGNTAYDDRGHAERMSGICIDITERKQMEAELRELNATLESKVAQRTEELELRAWQLRKLTLELTEAEERERARIAEILHDDLQQVLVAAKFQMSFLASRVKRDAEAQEIMGQARDLVVEAITKSRSLSHELSSPALAQTNLCVAFEWLARQMQAKHGFTVHLEMEDRLEMASEPLRMLLYKAAREMLFNAIKHARVAEAKLRLRRQRGHLRLSVSDRGRGIDLTDPAFKPGFGLLSIRERVDLLGGRLTIRSVPAKGSTFSVVIPDMARPE